MTIRTDWHEDVVTDGSRGVDPFDLASSEPMMSVRPLDPGMTAEQLKDRLKSLFLREKFLFDRMDLTCPIKDRCDTTCLACPLSEAGNTNSKKGSLCRVGIEQEQAETLLAVRVEAVRLEHGL